MGRLSIDCERAHLWVSLELDAEITELERSSLRAHLRGCEPCARYAHGAAVAARLVRDAPQLAPSRQLLEPRRRGRRRTLRLAASVAAVAAALAVGGIAGTLSSRAAGTSPQAEAASHRLLIQQSLLALMAGSSGPHDGRGRAVPT